MRNFVQVHTFVARQDSPRFQHLTASTRSQILPCREQDVVVVHRLQFFAHKDSIVIVDQLALGSVDVTLLAHVLGVCALVADEHVVTCHPTPPAGLLVVSVWDTIGILGERV